MQKRILVYSIITFFILLSGSLTTYVFFSSIPANYSVELVQPLHSASYIPIGVAVGSVLLHTDSQYRDLVLEHFNLVTAENAMKMGILRPTNETHFYWEQADYIVDFALNNSLQIHGHCLVYHYQLPDWLDDFEGDREDWMNLLKNHIQTVVGRYKGKITSWDVVNEAISENGYRETIWYTKIGPDYFNDAFIWAHEADPNAKLFYNDYNLFSNPKKLQTVVDKITELISEGVPIHGLGFQSHMSLLKPSADNIRNAVEILNELPIDIRISEMDIVMNVRNFYRSYTKKLADKQKELYVTLTKELLQFDNLASLTFWGVDDGHSWKNNLLHPDWPLLFDARYYPKPAAQGFLETLQEHFG